MSLKASRPIFRLCGHFCKRLQVQAYSKDSGELSKKPRNPFTIFWTSNLENLPKGKDGLIEAGRLWKNLPQIEKQSFIETSKSEFQNYTKAPISETEVTERKIKALKRDLKQFLKDRKTLLGGRQIKRKVTPYNAYVADLWRNGGSSAIPKKWRDLSLDAQNRFEEEARVLNEERDAEYSKNPLSSSEENEYVILTEKILKAKKEIQFLQRSFEN